MALLLNMLNSIIAQEPSSVNSKLILRCNYCFVSNVDTHICGNQYYCSSACNLDAAVSEFSNEAASGSILTSSKCEEVAPELIKNSFKSEEKAATTVASSNGRVMLIDGTSIIYRAYYKLLGMLLMLYIECKVFPRVSHLLTFDCAMCSKVESWSSGSC